MIDGVYYFVSDMEKAKNDLYNILYYMERNYYSNIKERVIYGKKS